MLSRLRLFFFNVYKGNHKDIAPYILLKMLQNAILAGGTWPRSRPSQGYTPRSSYRWNFAQSLGKSFSSSAKERMFGFKETKVNTGKQQNGIEAPKLTYDLLSSGTPSSHSSEHEALFSEEFLGVSFDSSTSFGDMFESFDTVSDVSSLSICTDTDRLEKCLADLTPRKISIDCAIGGFNTKQNSTNCVFDYDFCNGSLHGSFGNISLCAIDTTWTYGIRDLRSETNLQKLKEHIITGQQYKDQNANYLHVKDCKIKKRLSRSESDLSEKCRDILIPLNAGHITYQRDLPPKQPRQRYKVFSSKEELEPDFEAMSLDYYESLCYLRRKDIESCRVTGAGVKNGTVGKRAVFYIFTEKEKGDHLKIYISGPRLVPPEYQLATLTECFYSVSYLPERVGWYRICVLWRGRHVTGSPFHALMLLPKRKIWFQMDEL